MTIKKCRKILSMLCFILLPAMLSAQSTPEIIVVKRVHFNPASNFTLDDWKAVEKEYFDKVTAKNDLILGSNVLVHFYTNDNSEVLFVEAYHSWDDIEKANEKSNELARAAWPDSSKARAYFDKQRSFYTTSHSDEIRTITTGTRPAPRNTEPQIYYIRTSHRAYPADGKAAEFASLLDEYDQNVTAKNTLIRGYYPSRHFWGADSREFMDVFVYSSLADLEKSAQANQDLVNAHWPDEAKRKAFFTSLNKYFEPWHGDALYKDVPELRKIIAP